MQPRLPWAAIAYIRVRRGRLSVRLVTPKGCVGQYEDTAAAAFHTGENRIEAFGAKAVEEAQMPMRELRRFFDHPRVLIHDWDLTRVVLRHFLHQAGARRFRPYLHSVIWHPLEPLDGGITDIEVRALLDLAAASAGDGRIGRLASVVWQGEELSDAEVLRIGFASDEVKARITSKMQQRPGEFAAPT